MREQLIRQIEAYKPFNEQEAHDRKVILQSLREVPDIFFRTNPIAHMSASAWVINKEHNQVLMCWHNIYKSWSWLGGHADGNEDLLNVAVKEIKEESGLQTVVPFSEDIFSLEVLTVDGHEKNGRYVSSHLHLNITYLLVADSREVLHVKQDENSNVAWFSMEEAVEKSSEEWFRKRIYYKLNAKLQETERANCSYQ